MSEINKTMTRSDWVLLSITSLLWGGSFFFNAIAVRDLPPFTIVVLRVGIAVPILYLVVRTSGQRMPRTSKAWSSFIGMGLLNNVLPFSLIVWGQIQIASGLASILIATTPLFGVILAHFLTSDEKITRSKLMGVVLGFLGVVTMIGPSVLGKFGGTAVTAQLAVLGAALSHALAGIYGRRFKRLGIAPIVTATGQVTASTLILLPIEFVVDRPWTLPPPTGTTWAAVVGIAVLCTALAYTLYFRVLATVGATNLLLVTFLAPVCAILLGFMVLGEGLVPTQFLGMCFIGLGLAAIDGRLMAWAWSRRMGYRT